MWYALRPGLLKYLNPKGIPGMFDCDLSTPTLDPDPRSRPHFEAMNGLLSPSSISFDTLHSSTTASSASTVRGVGSVTGRAALAVGRLLLRGVDSLMVQRKLNVIASVLPCDDAKLPPRYQCIYADLLELSRCVAYPMFAWPDAQYKSLTGVDFTHIE